MTRDQAVKFLPDIYRKMGAGQSVDSMVSARAFVEWLYQHHFVILSRKERHDKKGKAE